VHHGVKIYALYFGFQCLTLSEFQGLIYGIPLKVKNSTFIFNCVQWRRHGLKVAGDKREELGDFVPPSQKVGGDALLASEASQKIFLDVPPIFLCVPPILGGTYRKIGGDI